MKKVAIIYQKAGGGHISLAKAIEDSLKTYYPNIFSVIMYDPLPEANARIYEVFNTKLIKEWGLFWHSTDNIYLAKFMQIVVYLFFGKKISKFIDDEKPDIIVSNAHPIVYSLKMAINRASHKPLTAIHVADPFSIHSTWLTYNDADLYLVPTVESAKILSKKVYRKDVLKVVGWPVRSMFYQKYQSKKTLRIKYKLSPNKFTIFIGGSGQGGGNILNLVTKILSSGLIKKRIQVIINTGSNRHLYNLLVNILLPYEDFHVVPYIDNMAEYLVMSDVILGKAGPNFMYETIFSERVLIATGCLPGQEEGNLRYIKSKRFGWVSTNPGETVKLLHKLINNNSIIRKMSKNTKLIKKQHINTSKNIADAIFWAIKVNE